MPQESITAWLPTRWARRSAASSSTCQVNRKNTTPRESLLLCCPCEFSMAAECWFRLPAIPVLCFGALPGSSSPQGSVQLSWTCPDQTRWPFALPSCSCSPKSLSLHLKATQGTLEGCPRETSGKAEVFVVFQRPGERLVSKEISRGEQGQDPGLSRADGPVTLEPCPGPWPLQCPLCKEEALQRTQIQTNICLTFQHRNSLGVRSRSTSCFQERWQFKKRGRALFKCSPRTN